MEPVNEPTRGEIVAHEGGSPSLRRSDRSTQGNFGFDASAWDPLGVLAAQIEERFQRRVRRRVEEALGLLRQVAIEAGPISGSQEIQALAFCLAEALVAEAGVSPGARPRLLQMVACHAFPAGQEVWAGEPSYWFYLNLMLKRFRQLQAEEGLEAAVRGALCACSPLLQSKPQVTRELAVELLEMLAAGGRSLTWQAVPPRGAGQDIGAADTDHPAPAGRQLSRAHRPLAGRPTASCAPPLAVGTSGT